MDLLLINPGSFRDQKPNEHLGILSLKSFTRSKGFNVDVIDMAIENLSVLDAVPKIIDQNPGSVGISMLDDTKKLGFALIKELRAAGYGGKIILGGYFPTFSARDILIDFSDVDFIVRGEGELTLVDLLDVIINGKKIDYKNIAGLSFRDGDTIYDNPSRPLITDLDILPPVDRKYAADCLQNKQPLRVFATRGCWGGCSFCDIISLYGHSRGKQWRRRPVDQVVEELAELSNTYETTHFIFNDDQFLVKGNKGLEYVEEFAAILEQKDLNITFDLMCRADTVTRPVMRRLQSVGLQRVFLGLESFDPKQLERYQKGISVRQNLKALKILKDEKIDVIASVILADAYTTLYDLLKQFAVLFQLTRRYFNSKDCQISVNKKLEVYRGSKVYREYKEKGFLTKDNYLEGYDFKLKPLTDLRLKMLALEEKTGRVIVKIIRFLWAAISQTGKILRKERENKIPVTQ
jgi:anaerobic magnesium-protoporphyrin IX monomethyl ester cyclase